MHLSYISIVRSCIIKYSISMNYNHPAEYIFLTLHYELQFTRLAIMIGTLLLHIQADLQNSVCYLLVIEAVITLFI